MINKENIDELIIKYLSGESSPEEAILLDEWKEENVENLRYFNESKYVYELHSGNASSEIDVDLAWDSLKSKLDTEKVKQLYPKRNYLRIAAILVLMISVASVVIYYFNNNSSEWISQQALAESKQVILDDQSKIIIAPHSEIIYSADFGKSTRRVKLKGDAYFDVTHDDSIPFVVDIGNVYIKDIGTKFDVRSSKDTDTIYVKVDEGIVLLFDSAGNELIIKASEKAVYVRSVKKIIIPQENTAAVYPAVNFNSMKLVDVVNELQAKYKVSIKIENKTISDCLITTQFNKEPIEVVLDVITETLGISYEKTNEGYLIKGTKCSN